MPLCDACLARESLARRSCIVEARILTTPFLLAANTWFAGLLACARALVLAVGYGLQIYSFLMCPSFCIATVGIPSAVLSDGQRTHVDRGSRPIFCTRQ